MPQSLNPESSWPGGEKSEPPPPRQKYFLPLILFVLTFFSTLVAGAGLAGVDPFQEPARIFSAGASFAVPLMFILLTHEFGHYLFSRYHRVDASLPYFLPAPSMIGTFGAIIRMRSPLRDRRALVDIGTAGPLAGFLVSIPAVIIGFKFSQIVPSPSAEGVVLGNSLLFAGLEKIFMGNLQNGQEVLIHPIGFAGWIGLFVTTLNLIPYGQLDGGHISYALLGRRLHRILGVILLPVLVIMGILGLMKIFGSEIWLVWAVFLGFIGPSHPPMEEARAELSTGRKILGWATMFIFLLTFIPAPFQMK
jgi:membrane-associated protease RseP (regulator of RpoE activity)